jgi:hypothetical protein
MQFRKHSFDLNANFIADLGARDKDYKAFYASNAISLASNILNCNIIDFALFDRTERLSSLNMKNLPLIYFS